MTKSSNETSKNRKLLLFVVVIFILLAINALQFYLTQSDKQKNQDLLEHRELELIGTFVKLDSISDELEVKIGKIQELGGNIDSLLEIQSVLQQEKLELQNSLRISQNRYEAIKSKVEGYEILLKKKDEDIVRLKETNDALLAENQTVKEKNQQLSSEISQLQNTTNELNRKVSTAAALRVASIELEAINRQGASTEGSSFRVRQLEKLRVRYALEPNELAEIGTKEIYLRIVEPDGSALYNLTAGSGSIPYKSGKIFYTKSHEILFDNSPQVFQFEFDKGTDFKKGQYQVELYSQGNQIGTTTFIVR